MSGVGAMQKVVSPAGEAPAGGGHARRMRALVEAYFDFIGRSLRRLGVADADVDDGSQQVFLVASRRLADVREGGEKAFLFGVALRVAADARRARRRRREVGDESLSDEPDAQARSPESLADERRARALLDEVLAAMPVDVRAVFVLFELEEMTMAEIAQVLDIPPGTVASRLRRGRELFHEHSRRLRARQPGAPGKP